MLNFVCKPAVARCLRTRRRRSRKSIAQTSLLLRVLTILLITFIKAIKCICLAFAITSLASVLLHDLKFSDELRHRDLIQLSFWASVFAQIGVRTFGLFIPNLRDAWHQVSFCSSRCFICLLSLAAAPVTWFTLLLVGYFSRDSRTSRRRRTSSPNTWMNLTIRCRPELRRFCWLMLFLLLLATFRPRRPEVNKILGGVFEDANSAERTQKVEHLNHDSTIMHSICQQRKILYCQQHKIYYFHISN